MKYPTIDVTTTSKDRRLSQGLRRVKAEEQHVANVQQNRE
jgi:hypothetical protein